MKKVLLGFLCLSSMTEIGWAATDCSSQPCRYVRAGASGTGTDWTNALPSLPAALTRGTTYLIADGSYPGYVFDDAVSGTTLITIKKATSSDHGTSTGWVDSYGDGQAAFTGGLEFRTSYWLLDGQTGGGPANGWDQNFGFKVTETSDTNAIITIAYSGTADNITIRHIDLQGKGSVSNSGGSYSNDAMAIYGAKNVTLSYFHMKGIGRCPFFISPQNAVFEYGWIQSYYGSEAVHSEVASIWGFDGAVGDVTFRNNLFTDIQSTGGLMWDNSSNTSAHLYVYGNVFYKPSGAVWGQANGVIGGWTGGGGEQFHNAMVINNTFVNVDQDELSTLPNISSGNVAYNNVFYNSQAPDFAKFSTHDYNHFINSGGTQSEAHGTTATNNPFASISGLDFRLIAQIPNGLAQAAPFNVDPYGLARGGDGVYDRGAYEYGSGSAPVPSPTPSPTATSTASPSPSPTASPTPISGGQSLLSNMAGPVDLASRDGVNYELGMRFSSTAAGQIKAIRFYKSASESGTHTGKIYSSSGALLASVVFSSETAEGWQQANLATALNITANTEYTVSVNTGNQYYVDTTSGLASQVVNGNLMSAVGCNGVYGSVGARPTNCYSDTNYYRDVVFVASTSPSPSPSPTATASVPSITSFTAASTSITSGQSTTLSWSVSGASSLTLNPGALNVTGATSKSVTPTATTTYTLTATNSAGSVSKSVTVTVAASTATQTLFTSQVPATKNNNDGVNYELGMRFKATVAGRITAIRFYKSSSESGTHTGKIYSSTGTLLASVVFSGETASGWQTMNLSTPLSIAANTEYTVSVNTGNKYYVDTVSGMASQITNGSLMSIVGNNGVYGPVGSRPTSSWSNSNYFRDVVFAPN
jgi:hypothetical protein